VGFIVSFLAFWYDFVVGDDWTVAVGVVAALIIGAALTRTSIPTWWWMPVIVALILTFSLLRATRSADCYTTLAAPGFAGLSRAAENSPG